MKLEVLVESLALSNLRKDRFFDDHEKENQKRDKSIFNKYPKFSFEYNSGHERSIEACQKPVKISVLNKILYLSKLTWKEIFGLQKEQGLERIPKKQFNQMPCLPERFKDIEQVDVFRLPSKHGRLIGYIEDEIFFAVWVDTKLDMYSH